MGVRVILTVEAGNGDLSYVEGTSENHNLAKSENYEMGKAAADALIPEGSKAIAIRTD